MTWYYIHMIPQSSIFYIWIKRTANLLTATDKFTDAVHKRHLKFYGYICRMDNSGFTKTLFNIINSMKVKINWLE